jgi:methylenetetrahydrofolate--tRNA-(uracil-5-)-methyltransferase
MLGALCHYISHASSDGYQPTNAAFGLLPEPPVELRRKKERRQVRASRAIEALEGWIAERPEQSLVGQDC